MATTVYLGDVVTMAEARPRAGAVVTEGERITFVGDADEALAAAGPDAEVVRLADGQVLLPGFIDGHGHLGLVTLFVGAVDLTARPIGSVGSIAELQDTLRAAMPEAVQDGWLLGFGYDDALMAEHRPPDRDDLDEVSQELGIVTIHASGHLAVLNSRALKICGITAASDNPAGGVIRRRPGGTEPDGVLEEHAWMDLAVPHLPRPGPQEAMQNLVAALSKYAAQGFTTVQEGFTDPLTMQLLLGGNQFGALNLDVVAYPSWQGAEQMLAGRSPDDGYSGRLRVGGAKIVLDGSPQGKTAWLTQPYLQPPAGMPEDYRGYPALPDDEVSGFFAATHERGWQVLAHVNGDAAADQFLRAATAARAGDGERDPRDFVMIHAQTVREDQLDAMAELGVTPSFFVTHVWLWGDWHRDSVFGAERAQRISPLRSTADRDIRFSLHNDSPVAPIRSLALPWAAVNRTTLSGQVLGPDQRIDAALALRALTVDGAYQYREEATKGTIEVGKQADLVVLGADPLAVDPSTIKDIPVLRTVSRGTTVFSA